MWDNYNLNSFYPRTVRHWNTHHPEMCSAPSFVLRVAQYQYPYPTLFWGCPSTGAHPPNTVLRVSLYQCASTQLCFEGVPVPVHIHPTLFRGCPTPSTSAHPPNTVLRVSQYQCASAQLCCYSAGAAVLTSRFFFFCFLKCCALLSLSFFCFLPLCLSPSVCVCVSLSISLSLSLSSSPFFVFFWRHLWHILRVLDHLYHTSWVENYYAKNSSSYSFPFGVHFR